MIVMECGSSPRVRGTRHDTIGAIHLDRFIPACAGNTSGTQRPHRSQTVHPRVCGEHCARMGIGSAISGSSPRVRGTHIVLVPRSSAVRFIPACAGNTRARAASRQLRAVHPRVCGEHDTMFKDTRPQIGSSPRVRGTLSWKIQHDRLRRFIPACAGNTRLPSW